MEKSRMSVMSKVKDVYVRYCFSQSKNTERLVNVLKGDFKPLAGIQGSLALYGHSHCSPFLARGLQDTLEKALSPEAEQRNRAIKSFKKIIKSQEFKEALSRYRQDIKKIPHHIKTLGITAIGIESEEVVIEDTLAKKDLYYSLYSLMRKTWGLSEREALDLLLVMVGPVIFLDLWEKCKKIKIFGAEGEIKKKHMQNFNRAFDEKKNNKVGSWTNIAIALCENFEARNREIAKNIQLRTGENILLVIGKSHVESDLGVAIQDMMPKTRKTKVIAK